MARNRKMLPQPSDEPVQDFRLIQTLHEARRHAQGQDGDGWDELARSLDDILGRMGAETSAPEATPDIGFGRIDRRAFDVDADTSTAVIASLMALADRPDPHQLELARGAVDELRQALG